MKDSNTARKATICRLTGCLLAVGLLFGANSAAQADEPTKGATKQVDLGRDATLELVYIPPGDFKMGSTPAEKKWAVGKEGGAEFSSGGGERESYEGKSRPMRVNNGFWMGRTEVTVGQFRAFVNETGFVTDAEKPGGKTQCFNRKWVPQRNSAGEFPSPWMAMEDKSWRDPNHGVAQRDDFPVVCVSYNDMNAFCAWLTKKEQDAGSLPDHLVYRLPTEAEWAYACRGGRSDSSYYWWGNDLSDAKGRLNISGMDFLPGEDYSWPRARLPWSDGFAMVSPVDHYGERGRNGFGLADMCGGVWEFVLDHFDPEGGHENIHYDDAEQRTVTRPVCRGGNFYDVPGNARCAVRLGIHSVTYSDSRDGFRICLGAPQGGTSAKGKRSRPMPSLGP
ncbi:MAG: formylglycine-generating enzyme family protein [Candidatus Hydrogenedentes bacterium]|nr:formylglycine-generating enzyme family protein [Candidatus Hydrogenedentota bacterium]